MILVRGGDGRARRQGNLGVELAGALPTGWSETIHQVEAIRKLYRTSGLLRAERIERNGPIWVWYTFNTGLTPTLVTNLGLACFYHRARREKCLPLRQLAEHRSCLRLPLNRFSLLNRTVSLTFTVLRYNWS